MFKSLSSLDRSWEAAKECVSARYLGYRVVPSAHDDRPFAVSSEKIKDRAVLLSTLHLGAPALLHLARLLLWACSQHDVLSARDPDAELKQAFRNAVSCLIEGPPGWMTLDVSMQLHKLGWPARVPSPDLLAKSLQMRVVLRLVGRVDCMLLRDDFGERLRDEFLPLMPHVLSWFKTGVVCTSAEVTSEMIRGNLIKRKCGALALGSNIRNLSFNAPKVREGLDRI